MGSAISKLFDSNKTPESVRQLHDGLDFLLEKVRITRKDATKIDIVRDLITLFQEDASEKEDSYYKYMRIIEEYCKKLREIEFQFYKDTGELQKRIAITRIPESKFPVYLQILYREGFTQRQRELLAEVCLDLTLFTGVKFEPQDLQNEDNEQEENKRKLTKIKL